MNVIHEHTGRPSDQGEPQHLPVPTGQNTRRRKSDQNVNPIEATVTKLLMATKQLLDGLTLWANRKASEDQVSDIFVQLATQFNLASQSFHEVGIDTSELAHIPDNLRNYLETALGEEPSPTSLDKYLPKIKEVIINLLQGLRLKQNLYREQYEARAIRLQTPPPQQPPPPPPPGATTTAAASTSNAHRTRISVTQPKQQPQIGMGRPIEPPSTLQLEGKGSDYRYFSASDQNQPVSTIAAAAPSPTLTLTVPPSSQQRMNEHSHAETLASLRKSDAITRRASSRRQSQRFSRLVEENTPAPPMPRRQHPVSDSNMMATYPTYANSMNVPMAPSPLADPRLAILQSQMSILPTPTIDQFPAIPGFLNPNVEANMSNMGLMSLAPEPLGPSSSGETNHHPHPAMPFTPSAPDAPKLSDVPHTPTEPLSTMVSPSEEITIPEPVLSKDLKPAPIEPEETGLTLFLQVGKSVKKAKLEEELTHSGLRMLFMEKFQYNPGQDDFPAIYVKDPQTNIHYELESLADVKQNAFLSLNVDDLENIQRKMDQGFAALAKELHDIKKTQEAMEQARQKAAAAAASAAAAAAINNTLDRNLPPSGSDNNSQMFRSLVNKAITKNKGDMSTPSSEQLNKIKAVDLRPYYDEIQTLRRDLGVVRQLYTELQNETKSTLGSLASYTSQLRKHAQESPVSSRQFIESGKIKLDKKSEDLTNKIEDLQDVVEDMKINIVQRRGRPSDSSMVFVDKQCEEIEKDIVKLSDYIHTLRPSWKKTWEAELQTIVKEQMFLKEQEALLEDIKEDRISLLQTLDNLKKVMALQARNSISGNGNGGIVFQPAPLDENFEGLKTVMEEVKLIEPDSEKRLKAMAQMEKLRHIELSNKIDEFEQELTTFVGASKLRKTGGAMEIERQRQQRDHENLKAMFSKDKAEGVDNAVPGIIKGSTAVEAIEEKVEDDS
ncbi:Bud site selection protein 6 [Lobosporangium transversale]|uniref:Actin interacting protein 3-domain-containing protein n=1 Tax=Lobosporangium transversale TaxID=64571 RepID=A0A1Y2GP10_9FUNG|nr:actin interacting protein 3-domain-containing protein [Lobosporangium transversale]KAF9918148.1 Bud site selection protein 6 [Lobosporangium transversale]ORZ16788.1 actin interacting protein 3-domain-containing protein [Lobosporangium transversale]|eukprot:XP_021881723.1 actin interacting protein 3-domain-containing protein [Lobosporangium transversale]